MNKKSIQRSIQCLGKKCKYNENGKCKKKYINVFEIPVDMEVVNDDYIKINALCHDYIEGEDKK